MWRTAFALIVVMALLTSPTAVLAQSYTSDAVMAGTPLKPAPLTVAQFDALLQLESQPEHSVVLDVHATYASDHERHLDFNRASDDFWTAVYQAGFPGTIATILIIAAPL